MGYFLDDYSSDDPYHTDEDEEFLPNITSLSENSSENSEQSETDTQHVHNIHVTPKRTRKRKICMPEWNRNNKKKLRTEGKCYIGYRGVEHPEKQLQVFNHTCRYKCNENIAQANRQALFENFYKLPSYDLQTAYLSSCIIKNKPKRQKSNRPRNFSTKIMLLNKRVCKSFFFKLLK